MRPDGSEGSEPPPATDGRSWRPWAGRRWCYAAGAGVALLLAVRSEGGAFGTGTGIPFLVVAVVLAVLAVLDVWFGVPLVADPAGLRISRGPERATTIPWAAVTRIEAARATSRGLFRVTSLEIDARIEADADSHADEQLLVLTRHRLGADPEDVADELRRRWPTPPPPRRP